MRDPAAYAAFWADAQREVDAHFGGRSLDRPASATITLDHAHETSALNRYQSIDHNAVDRPLHVFSGTVAPQLIVGSLENRAGPVLSKILEISFRVYDHGLMVLEALSDVTGYLGSEPAEVEQKLDTLQQDAVQTGDALARAVVQMCIDPALELLRKLDESGSILEPPAAEDDAQVRDFGRSMWVTRSLIVDPAEPVAEQAIRHWVKDVATTEFARPPADELVDGERDHLVRWLNYLFVDRSDNGEDARTIMGPGGHFNDQWEALRYAQVFYGVIDRIDSRLSRILAHSATADSRLDLEHLRADLTGLSRRAELIILERQDLAKYLKRAVRLELDAIMSYWDYEQLLETPVKYKVGLCNQRLAELGSRRAARSTMFTDIILLGIAMTSVLATALALTEFGRSVANDPNMAVYDFGRSSIVAWVAGQPADAILVSSGVISALIVLVYLFFRRDNGS
ncbi:hypothetical protein AB1046_22055 [Promicromonospora sp. Populi]|uniref:hypothetical protein n=1 Tax=Promicromonospora sp. Populi TaxID=3239420 RepID=UPI0034E23B3F